MYNILIKCHPLYSKVIYVCFVRYTKRSVKTKQCCRVFLFSDVPSNMIIAGLYATAFENEVFEAVCHVIQLKQPPSQMFWVHEDQEYPSVCETRPINDANDLYSARISAKLQFNRIGLNQTTQCVVVLQNGAMAVKTHTQRTLNVSNIEHLHIHIFPYVSCMIINVLYIHYSHLHTQIIAKFMWWFCDD